MLRHVCIEVKNMPVALIAAFYAQHFGMELVYEGKEEWELREDVKVMLRVIKLKCKGSRTLLELVQHHNEWTPHICLEVDKWPDLPLIEPKRIDKEHKGLEVKFCMDPSGNMIELVKRKEK